MSTIDDKATEVPEDAAGESAETAPPEQEKEEVAEKKEINKGLVIFVFIAAFVASLIVGWILFPMVLYTQEKQPIDFNHALHLEEVENGCESCHFFREDGSYAGVPKLAQCVDCHDEVMGDDPDELAFVENYVQKNIEVPWLIYSQQSDCVFFSHAAHVKAAKMDCVSCHGDIGESTSLKVYEKNIITGISRDVWGKNIGGIKLHSWDRMKMNDCAKCHKEETGNQGACFQCHK